MSSKLVAISAAALLFTACGPAVGAENVPPDNQTQQAAPAPYMMGPGYGQMMGYGRMGYGPMGPGMMGQGYMMGPGMMGYGPGGTMMGRGMMRGGMMGYGPGYGQGYGPGYGPMMGRPVQPLDLSVSDVKTNLERWLALRGNPNLKVGKVKEMDKNTISAEIVTKDNSLVRRYEIDRATGFVRAVG